MGRLLRNNKRAAASRPPSFSKSEIKQMEKLLLEKRDDLLDESFYQKITVEFNLAPGRVGSRALQVEQVQKWFENDQKTQATEVTSSPVTSRHLPSDASHSSDAPKSSNLSLDAEEKGSEPKDLEFEAKSSRDNAWYDVAMFLAHRIKSGELEVLVRYQSYGAEEDEWVNVKKAIRQRSLPLESSECTKVAVGDLVLCFRESSEQATYYDAHILEIERKMHDIRGCRCLFLVRYDHDQAEEKVHLRKLCCRPY